MKWLMENKGQKTVLGLGWCTKSLSCTMIFMLALGMIFHGKLRLDLWDQGSALGTSDP